MEMKKICEFIRQLRKERGLTQEEAAEQLFVSSKTLSRWETGRTIPDLETILRLADFYSVDVKELLNGQHAAETPEEETLQKEPPLKLVAEYSKKKEKQAVRRAVFLFAAAALLVIGVYILIQHLQRLQGEEQQFFRGNITWYTVEEETNNTLIYLDCDTYNVRILITPDTIISSEELRERLASQEDHLPVSIVSIYQIRDAYNATKHGGRFTYPAYSIDLWGE